MKVNVASSIEQVYSIETDLTNRQDNAHRLRVEVSIDRGAAYDLIRHNLVDGQAAADQRWIETGGPENREALFGAATAALASVLRAAIEGQSHEPTIRLEPPRGLFWDRAKAQGLVGPPRSKP